ncbi:MAG: hypothetical protein JXR83_20690 [Deltaproteobacteria bacterium]|nr:hypothetical protein [Deltaproteobacteria bacterium]
MNVDEALRALKQRERPASERMSAVEELGRSNDPRAQLALQDVLDSETDAALRDAISTALRRSRATVLDLKRPKLDRDGR